MRPLPAPGRSINSQRSIPYTYISIKVMHQHRAPSHTHHSINRNTDYLIILKSLPARIPDLPPFYATYTKEIPPHRGGRWNIKYVFNSREATCQLPLSLSAVSLIPLRYLGNTQRANSPSLSLGAGYICIRWCCDAEKYAEFRWHVVEAEGKEG